MLISKKLFGSVDDDILIQKLNQYGMRGVAYYWFLSYLDNWFQYVSINGVNSKLEHINSGVPQGSILEPLLFLIYINDLNCAIRYCSVHHFPDDTNLLDSNNWVKRMSKQVNRYLKNLINWPNANKIFLNVSKTEAVLFKSSSKLADVPPKLKLDRKRLSPTISCYKKWWKF